MEKNSAEKNMSISLVLENIYFQGGKTDITDKKQPSSTDKKKHPLKLLLIILPCK